MTKTTETIKFSHIMYRYHMGYIFMMTKQSVTK